MLLHCSNGKYHHHGINHKATIFEKTSLDADSDNLRRATCVMSHNHKATTLPNAFKKQTLIVMNLSGMTCVMLMSVYNFSGQNWSHSSNGHKIIKF